MLKIGRNDKCPCLSGKKYKHCCAMKDQSSKLQPPSQGGIKVTLMSGVNSIQADAASRKVVCREIGVFFFYATEKGDAWVLEMTDCDAIMVAREGVPLAAPIDENSEIIEINWSHRFAIDNKQLVLTAYADKSVQILSDAPTRELNAAMRRMRKNFSSEQLEKVHLPNPEKSPAV